MSDLRVTNLKGRTAGSAPILPDGAVVTGVVTATSFSGDGSALTGIDATSLKDGNGTIRVQANTSGVEVTGVITATTFSGDGSGLIGVASTDNIVTTTPANFADINSTGIITAVSFSGDGSSLTFAPKIIAFDPAALSTGIAADTNITITFDQDIQFAGTGTVELRSTTNSGTIIESFAITSGSAASGLSISGTQLIINPTSSLSDNTVVYVILPSQGIANLVGTYYAGSNNYNFRTVEQTFSAEGGDSVFTVYDTGSPTNYYKYHVFTSAGIATFSSPTSTSPDLQFLMVGGGGGGGGGLGSPRSSGGGGGAGGVINKTQSNLGLPAGNYTVVIGAGGNGAAAAAPGGLGGDTTFSGPITMNALGGGAGAGSPNTMQSGGSGGSGGGGSAHQGAAANSYSTGGSSLDPSQGNSGGRGTPHATFSFPNPSPYPTGNGGGGGGAGGAGGDARSWPGTPPANNFSGGDGGAGRAVPAFRSSSLSGNVPSLNATTLASIGPTGLYGGGGGGGFGPGPGSGQGGLPGPGGGGGGGPFNDLSAPQYAPYPPAYRGSAWPFYGSMSTGGGGGGAGSSSWPGQASTPSTQYNGSGGSGVVMFRYAVPAP